jgi:hypothetical protein
MELKKLEEASCGEELI